MLKQEIILRKFGKDTVEFLLQDYHAFIFCLHTTDEENAASIANTLMYDISLNLANEWLELNWGNWVLISPDTAWDIGINGATSEESYYLMGFLVDSTSNDAPAVNKFLESFIPGEFINFGKRPLREERYYTNVRNR